jgi:hypothetical protein
MDSGSETVSTAMAEMAANATASDDENEATTDAVGNALMGIGAAIAIIPGVGTIIGVVLAAIGAIVRWFAKLFYIECDKYHCGGYDRDTSYDRRNYTRHLQALVGLHPGNESKWTNKSDCGCDYKSHRCSFIKYFHDGLIVEGLDVDVMEAEPVSAGQVRGANALRMPQLFLGDGRVIGKTAANAWCIERWRTNSKYAPLTANGRRLYLGWGGSNPSTDEIVKSMSEPWTCPAGTYFARSWKVHNILAWMELDQILCRTMECMEDVLEGMPAVGEDDVHDQRRRRGSRWYASIVWMMHDVWVYGRKLGGERFREILREAGVTETAIDVLGQMRKGKEYEPMDVPFEWWPFMRFVSFWQMRAMLVEMHDEFPYVPVMTKMDGEPRGAEARAQSTVLGPMMLPILQPITFGDRLKPRPAPRRLGRRGPSIGVLAFGVGAAAVGAFAIYKLIAPTES